MLIRSVERLKMLWIKISTPIKMMLNIMLQIMEQQLHLKQLRTEKLQQMTSYQKQVTMP